MKGTIHKRLIRQKEGQSKGFIRNLALVALLLPALLCGCSSGLEGTIVAVEIPAGQSEPEMGARLIAWDPETPENSINAGLGFMWNPTKVMVVESSVNGETGELVSAAVYLASDESAYVTGTTIYIDGGRMGMNYTC